MRERNKTLPLEPLVIDFSTVSGFILSKPDGFSRRSHFLADLLEDWLFGRPRAGLSRHIPSVSLSALTERRIIVLCQYKDKIMSNKRLLAFSLLAMLFFSCRPPEPQQPAQTKKTKQEPKEKSRYEAEQEAKKNYPKERASAQILFDKYQCSLNEFKDTYTCVAEYEEDCEILKQRLFLFPEVLSLKCQTASGSEQLQSKNAIQQAQARENQACSRKGAAQELSETGEAITPESTEKKFKECIDRRVALCQAELDQGDVKRAKECWMRWPWKETNLPVPVSTYLQTHNTTEGYSDDSLSPVQIGLCLEGTLVTRSQLSDCLAAPEKTYEEMESKFACLMTSSADFASSCGPLNLEKYVTMTQESLEVEKAISTLASSLAPKICSDALADIDAAVKASDLDLARKTLEFGRGPCRTEPEKLKLIEAEKKIAALEKEIKRCAGLSVEQFIMNLTVYGFDSSTAVKCEYNFNTGTIYGEAAGYLIASVSNGSLGLVALKTSEALLAGSLIIGRRVQFLGIKKITLEGRKISILAFKLLS